MIFERRRFLLLLSSALILCTPSNVHGDAGGHSPAMHGFLGLNTTPNARMDQVGTLRAGISALDPFMHSFISAQFAQPLAVTFRQTAETSGPFNRADRLLPGVDFKLRLLEENGHRPALAFGVQSALGHRRMAGEYFALSKRYRTLDLTAGIGWGRLGTSAQLDNPFAIFGGHFKGIRDLSSDSPNTPADLFTGDKVGLFAGIEYFLPCDGLSLKLDYGGDRYTVERASISGFEAPAPWGIGLAYRYGNWLDAQIGMQGTDKIMGRLSLSGQPERWPFTPDKAPEEPALPPGSAFRDSHFHATVEVSPDNGSSPRRIGSVLRAVAQNEQARVKDITLNLTHHGLKGPSLTFLQRDVERALTPGGISPNELWHSTSRTPKPPAGPVLYDAPDEDAPVNLSVILDTELSLSEEDKGALWRTAALVSLEARQSSGFLSSLGLRINLADNLDTLDTRRAPALPVRSDIAAFTNRTISLERSALSYVHSLTPAWHGALSAGYLEEFYAGFGGEILYRPTDSRLALGLEAWQAFRRDPHTFLNTGLNGTQVTSGHATLWYDIPHHDLTAKLSAGRFLAGDSGLSAGLEKRWHNGAVLRGDITVSNASDIDPFGEQAHAYHRLQLDLPLGSPYWPLPGAGTIRTTIAPLGRDSAQRLQKPIDLYALSEPLTLNHLARHWPDITE